MKKILFILTFTLFAGFVAQAQDDDNDRIRDKMREFIQRRLNLSRNEADRFSPVFIRYFKEWRQALRENKNDGLVRQQRIIDLRLRYRTEFREIVGDKRSNDVYKQQDIFVREITKMRNEQIKARSDGRTNRRQNILIQ